MTTVKDSNPHGRLAQDRLIQFENSLSTSLPNEYRAFLIEHNGARLIPGEIIFPGTTDPYTMLSMMFGLHDGEMSLYVVRRHVVDCITDEALAIAEDHAGNLICIGLRGAHHGHIFFWQHDNSLPDTANDDWQGMRLLAESFDAFIEALGKPQPGRRKSPATHQ